MESTADNRSSVYIIIGGENFGIICPLHYFPMLVLDCFIKILTLRLAIQLEWTV